MELNKRVRNGEGGRVKEDDVDFRTALHREIVEEVGSDAEKSGELKIAEPDKCLGYERYRIGEVDEKELSNGAKELYGIVSRKYGNLR